MRKREREKERNNHYVFFDLLPFTPFDVIPLSIFVARDNEPGSLFSLYFFLYTFFFFKAEKTTDAHLDALGVLCNLSLSLVRSRRKMPDAS